MLDRNTLREIACLSVKFLGSILFDWGCIVVHPEATIAEARAFLSSMDPTVAPFCPSEIVRAEHILGLRRNASSSTCEKVYW
jgi:hypothetical protein